MPKHGNDPPVLVYSRAFARDGHYLAHVFLEAQHEVVHKVLAHRPRNGSHLHPYGFLEVGDGWSVASLSTRGSKFAPGLCAGATL